MEPVSLHQLDAFLRKQSFIGSAASITLEDYRLCTQIKSESVDQEHMPHLARWHSHVSHLVSQLGSDCDRFGIPIPLGQMPEELQKSYDTKQSDSRDEAPSVVGPCRQDVHDIDDLCAERQRTTACTSVLDKAGISYLRVPVDPNDGHHQEIDPATGRTYTRIADHVRKNPQLSLSTLMKSMVFEYGADVPLMVLMTKEYKIDPKKVAALLSQRLGAKISQSKVKMMKEEDAIKFTGFQFGGTTAIGIAAKMIVYAQEDIQQEDQIFINGGSKAFLVGLARKDLESVVEFEYADLAKK